MLSLSNVTQHREAQVPSGPPALHPTLPACTAGVTSLRQSLQASVKVLQREVSAHTRGRQLSEHSPCGPVALQRAGSSLSTSWTQPHGAQCSEP